MITIASTRRKMALGGAGDWTQDSKVLKDRFPSIDVR
jgi:hypothetical protein